MLHIDLTDRVAVITGTTSGIGAGLASAFAQAGCHVSGCGKRKETHRDVQKFVGEVESHGAKALYTRTDVMVDTELEYLVHHTIKKFGKIDFLISNAGLNVFKGTAECSNEDFKRNMDLNLRSHWKLSQLCRPYLRKSDNGTILIMTSNHAYHTISGCFPYSMAKTALKGLVQSLAIEWGPEIRALGIAPGFIETEGGKAWFDSFPDPEAERKRTYSLHPSGRIGTPMEVGAFCAFLCSRHARFMNGATYLMDGGRSALMQDI